MDALASSLTTYFTAKNQKAPQYAGDVDLQKVQGDVATANLNNSPLIESLLNRGNTFNQSQNNQMLEQAVGGYGDWSKQMSKNASAYASGQLSDEQANNLNRLAAERGVSTGRGGQAGKFSLLRDLGISQMQGQQQSNNIMQSLVGMSKVSPMSPLSFYVTNQQGLDVAQSNKGAYQSWLNAEQASKNVRSNAFWAAYAAGNSTINQSMGMGNGGEGGGNTMGGIMNTIKMFKSMKQPSTSGTSLAGNEYDSYMSGGTNSTSFGGDYGFSGGGGGE